MTTVLQQRAPAPIDATPGDEIPRIRPMLEVGSGGLRRNSGYVDDEFLPALRGRKAVKIYREISDNSPVIGGWYTAVSQLLRQIEWPVEPGGKSADDRKAAEFLEQNMEDMEHSWGDMITEIAEFVIYGWELSEINYKRRRGPWTTGRDHSAHTDGMTGWRSINSRAHETILRWVFGPKGEILGAVQQAAPRYERVVLPMGKCLLFRTTKKKNNPEGRSLIRNCYEPWYYLKRHQEIEAVGVARDLAGMPIARVPSKILSALPGTADGDMLDAVKKLVTSVSRNENEGIVWPYDQDPDTKESAYQFELLNSGGTRQFDTESIINRYKTEMLQAVLADWMQVGHEENGGAYNMHVDKLGLFRTLTNALAQMIADEINRRAVPELFRLNNWKPANLPKIVPNNVDPPDLATIGAFLQQLAALGVNWFPDPVLEKYFRDAADLPQLDDQTEKMLEEGRKQAIMMQRAQQQLEALQIGQQAATGQQQLEQGQQQLQQGKQALEAGPGATDPNDAKRSKLGVDRDKVKVSQEKAKLANIKTQGKNLARNAKTSTTRTAARSAPNGKSRPQQTRSRVKKAYTLEGP